MHKLKLMIILGTRSEIIILSDIIKKCYEFFDVLILNTNQDYSYELNKIFFKELNIKEPLNYFELNEKKNTEQQLSSEILLKSYSLLSSLKPDAFLITGDSESYLSAIVAKKLKIPVFHMNAGNREAHLTLNNTDNITENYLNNKIIDNVSDFYLVFNQNNKNNLIQENVKKENIFNIGEPKYEIFFNNMNEIENNDVLKKYSINNNTYILISITKEENLYLNYNLLIDSLNKIAEYYNIPIIFPAHNKITNIIKKRESKFNHMIRLLPPLGFFAYNNLQKNSFCVLSDSSSLGIESEILNFPAVKLRNTTENTDILENTNIVISDLSALNIVNSIKISRSYINLKDKNYNFNVAKEEMSSYKVVKIIQSYTRKKN